MTNYDIVVLGGGPGGYVSAIRSAQLGNKTAIIDDARLGGSCLHWGCIPTKALLKNAEILHYVKNSSQFGILVCGSGVGMAIRANRDKNIRAGLAFNPEIAKLMRAHNNANVLVLPGKFMNIHDAIKCVENFLSTNFDGGRHEIRVNKLS